MLQEWHFNFYFSLFVKLVKNDFWMFQRCTREKYFKKKPHFSDPNLQNTTFPLSSRNLSRNTHVVTGTLNRKSCERLCDFKAKCSSLWVSNFCHSPKRNLDLVLLWLCGLFLTFFYLFSNLPIFHVFDLLSTFILIYYEKWIKNNLKFQQHTGVCSYFHSYKKFLW